MEEANAATHTDALPSALSVFRGRDSMRTGCASRPQPCAAAYRVWKASRPVLYSGAAASFFGATAFCSDFAACDSLVVSFFEKQPESSAPAPRSATRNVFGMDF